MHGHGLTNSSGVASPLMVCKSLLKSLISVKFLDKLALLASSIMKQNQFFSIPLKNSAINHAFYALLLLYLSLRALVKLGAFR
jgi:hypothetical protein